MYLECIARIGAILGVSFNCIDEVKEELLSILLTFRGKFGVSFADERPEHPGPDAGS